MNAILSFFISIFISSVVFAGGKANVQSNLTQNFYFDQYTRAENNKMVFDIGDLEIISNFDKIAMNDYVDFKLNNKLLGRFINRSNFSSKTLEKMVDGLRLQKKNNPKFMVAFEYYPMMNKRPGKIKRILEIDFLFKYKNHKEKLSSNAEAKEVDQKTECAILSENALLGQSVEELLGKAEDKNARDVIDSNCLENIKDYFFKYKD